MLTRTHRNGIRPIEIGRQIVAAMDKQAETNNGEVAHRYVIGLHKSDLAALGAVSKPLLSELRQAITNHAQFEGYSLSGEAEVVLVEDVAMRPGLCMITNTKTSTIVLQPLPQSLHEYVLVLEDDSRHALVGDLVTIGRQASCTIVIADNNISRVHARFRQDSNGWTIEDLGSTNGTTVDGLLITAQTPLADGQKIALGSLQIRFERA